MNKLFLTILIAAVAPALPFAENTGTTVAAETTETSEASAVQPVKISVADAQFTRPLISKWIAEYKKVNPDFNAEVVVASAQTEAVVTIVPQFSVDRKVVGRFFILPIVNADNDILADKKVQKGLNGKLQREIFVQKNIDEYLDNREKKSLPGTVYSLAGKHAAVTTLLANSLNVAANEIKGKKILGKEENALSVVRKQKDAISVNVASLVYDEATRRPVSGITVLPTDLNGDGKVSEEERSAFTTLDSLTSYLSASAGNTLPSGSIRIDSSDGQLEQFMAWVENEGQQYLKDYGYLPVAKTK